ncbi:MAG: TetR/AcrR family transcriptional regulator, partial [Hyphomicrobiales bacterium]
MPVMKHGARQQGKAQTRNRILDAALELFASEGFDHTTIRMIGQRCGLRDGSLYYYFPSKEAILRCLMEERWDLAPPLGKSP